MKNIKNNRENERGAALVIVVLISFLLLIGSASVLITASQFAPVASDAVSEQQSYYAAESGLQSALNVLRGNVAPNPLLGNAQANKIDYRKAVEPSTSNHPNDPSNVARLSRWVNYSYTPPGAPFGDRVATGENYAPLSGMAYRLAVSDPDHTKQTSFATNGCASGNNFTYGSAQISFSGATQNNLTTYPAAQNISLGSISLLMPANTTVNVPSDARINICVTMTKPFPATARLRGWLREGDITGSQSTTTARIEFDSLNFTVEGTKFTLPSRTMSLPNRGGSSQINATVTAPNPRRLLVRSEGLGPRGGRKVLETIVRNDSFDSLSVPSTINLIGASNNFSFATGNSQNVAYRGDDVCNPEDAIPAFGVTNDTNLNTARNGIGNKPELTRNVTAQHKRDETVQNIDAELPDWLTTAAKLDKLINSLRETAKKTGRYFADGTAPNSLGSSTEMKGLTFIDGDASLSQAGGGILVVTGNLTFNGGFDFKGLVIVTGSEGLRRNGGGNGRIEGNIVVAPYNPSNLAAGFGSPKFDTNGGGNSTIQYNSCAANNALNSFTNLIAGVAEK
jgi:hypothetical protein